MKTLVAAAVLALASVAMAQEPAQVERRLQSVAALIELSSAARQIESSGVPAAREKRDNARLVHREAAAALAAGDAPGAARLLDQAAREMMAGARLARPEQVAGEKARRDYEARLDSVRALLAAQQRITQEKGMPKEAADAARSIAAQVADAERLAAAGRTDDAKAVVDRAYLTARVSIEGLRHGDTLVRSLHFATPREEYDYEVDRNETHRLLVQVVLADRQDLGPLVQPFVDRAVALRAEAEAQAKRGDHAGAISVLEASTRELVRAIRAGGLYIPG